MRKKFQNASLNTLTGFIKEEINPRVWENVTTLFAGMGFKLKGSKWISGLHVDLDPGSGPKEDRCVITRNYPSRIFDNTRQTSTDAVTAFMMQNPDCGNDVMKAVRKMCDLLNIEPPQSSPEAVEAYKHHQERLTQLEQSHERQIKAFWSEEGNEARQYLEGRGWSEAEMKLARFGYMSDQEARLLQAQPHLGTIHKLSLPLTSSGQLYGFKVRTIGTPPAGIDKYEYLSGTSKKYNLFGLTPIRSGTKEVIVLEGELDALHARIKGLDNAIATGGGKLTEEHFALLEARDVKRIVLLFDTDDAGEKYTLQTINLAHQHGLTIFVAQIPSGETLPNGTPVHDVDEYLQLHSIDDLRQVINNARIGGGWAVDKIINDYAAAHPGAEERGYNDIETFELNADIIACLVKIENEQERECALSDYANNTRRGKEEIFNAASIRAAVDRERAKEMKQQQRTQANKAAADISQLIAQDKTDEAIKLMKDTAATLDRLDTNARVSKLLAIDSYQERLNKARHTGESIRTPYFFQGAYDTTTEQLVLPTGAITLICAATSHGKSTMLRNLALHTAQHQEEGEGVVLYYTYEESKEAVDAQMTNTFIGRYLNERNLLSINEYRKYGGSRNTFHNDDCLKLYQEGDMKFYKELIATGKLRIYEEEDSYVDTLITDIQSIANNTLVKAVYIDYAQEIYKRNCNGTRREELRDVIDALKNLAKTLHLPIIIAAQLNRDAKSPADMYSQNISEAADLERTANTVILCWNSVFAAQGKGDSNGSNEELNKLLKRTGIELQHQGRMYVRIAKNREGTPGLEAVLTHDGNTGRLTQQMPTMQTVQEREARKANSQAYIDPLDE